jgi:3-mercaptopyruvate sulfurtransferase SseA
MRRKARRQGSLLPIVLIAAGALLVLGVLIWQIVRSTTSQAGETPGQPVTGQNIPHPEIERVTLEDAREALDNQQAVFLDVRDGGSFETGHIPGALNIPLAQLESRLVELDASQWIITYCT